MRGPVERFSELGLDGSEPATMSNEMLPSGDAIAREATAALAAHGLVRMPDDFFGRSLLISEPNGDRSELFRTGLFTSATPEEVLPAVRAHIARIAEKHGPGRVWFLLEPVHVVCDDGMYRAEMVDGAPHVRMRTFYGHEAQRRPWA